MAIAPKFDPDTGLQAVTRSPFARWVLRSGEGRVAWVFTIVTVLASLLITWLVHVVLGIEDAGVGLAIAVVVPIVLTQTIGRYHIRLLAALEAARLQLLEMAITDSLTLVSNRRHFMTMAEREFSRAGRDGSALSVLLLDVDDFKRVNDTYGHQVGDTLLVQIGAACRAAARQSDVVARFGGEEFILLLPSTSVDDAVHLAERLRESVMQSAARGASDAEVRVTVSVGVAQRDERTPSLDALIRCADVALYESKRAGRNCVRVASAVAA